MTKDRPPESPLVYTNNWTFELGISKINLYLTFNWSNISAVLFISLDFCIVVMLCNQIIKIHALHRHTESCAVLTCKESAEHINLRDLMLSLSVWHLWPLPWGRLRIIQGIRSARGNPLGSTGQSFKRHHPCHYLAWKWQPNPSGGQTLCTQYNKFLSEQMRNTHKKTQHEMEAGDVTLVSTQHVQREPDKSQTLCIPHISCMNPFHCGAWRHANDNSVNSPQGAAPNHHLD